MAKEQDMAGSRGERLRKLRKSKGLSLEQLHKGTKIHMSIIRAIEEDELSGMAPAYIRGLLKIYCAFLGADAKEFMEGHDQDESKKKREATDYPAPQESIPLAEPKIRLKVMKRGINIKPIIFIICLLVLGTAVARHRKNKSISIATPKPKDVPVVSAPAAVVNSPRLGIRAKEDCWLEVKSDGRTIFKGILKKGRSDFWEAQNKIQFTVGSAGAIEVEVNRRILPPLGRRGQVIKNILVTKDGLIAPE